MHTIVTLCGGWIGVRTFHCQHDFGFNSRGFTTNRSHSAQQTNLAFTAEEAAAEQAWISSLLPEALTRRT